MLLHLLDAAKRAPRREARVLARHAIGHELVFEQLQMGVDLTCEFGLGAGGSQHRRQA